jgi:hypothetical protein
MSDKCNKLLTTLLADLTLRFYIAPGIQLKAGGISVADLICRAELHGSPSREQYDEFHAGMEALGLERTIKPSDLFNVACSQDHLVGISHYREPMQANDYPRQQSCRNSYQRT